jgi:hypothetical protein
VFVRVLEVEGRGVVCLWGSLYRGGLSERLLYSGTVAEFGARVRGDRGWLVGMAFLISEIEVLTKGVKEVIKQME